MYQFFDILLEICTGQAFRLQHKLVLRVSSVRIFVRNRQFLSRIKFHRHMKFIILFLKRPAVFASSHMKHCMSMMTNVSLVQNEKDFFPHTNQKFKGVNVMSMFSNIGVPGLIIILVLALIIFGPKKLPELGRAAGQTLREFKHSTQGLIEDEKETIVEAVKLEKEPKSN